MSGQAARRPRSSIRAWRELLGVDVGFPGATHPGRRETRRAIRWPAWGRRRVSCAGPSRRAHPFAVFLATSLVREYREIEPPHPSNMRNQPRHLGPVLLVLRPEALEEQPLLLL